MSKAFTKETDGEGPDDGEEADALPVGVKNYMTPQGFAVLQAELKFLLRQERPRIVEIVSWAAGNGDRSENGDYLYNKKRLREIDRRVRYLTKRVESADVVDSAKQVGLSKVFFGAFVMYAKDDGAEHTVQLVGVDEADLAQGKINWQSPLGRALLNAEAGDEVTVRTPAGVETVEVVKVWYSEEDV